MRYATKKSFPAEIRKSVFTALPETRRHHTNKCEQYWTTWFQSTTKEMQNII